MTTAIILTGLGTYAMRAFFIFALARYSFPPIMLRALEYVAPTVMGALVISMMTNTKGELTAGWAESLGLLGAAVVAKWTGNHIFALLSGMGAFWIIRWLI